QGREEARKRQQDERSWATAGVFGAIAAGAGVRGLSTTRRRLLRGALRSSALIALMPSAGLSILSELFVPDELQAFDDLAAQLARVETPATGSIA
ncbi:MAG: hypothetical protein VCE43_17835, partial [Myxococcota bacterium]